MVSCAWACKCLQVDSFALDGLVESSVAHSWAQTYSTADGGVAASPFAFGVVTASSVHLTVDVSLSSGFCR